MHTRIHGLTYRHNTDYILFLLLFLFTAVPAAHGRCQPRGQIGAEAASLHHNYSNTGSELHLQPMLQPWQHQILSPLREARDQTQILTETTSEPLPAEPQWELPDCIFLM